MKAEAAGGNVRASQWRQHQARLAAMRNLDPFHFRYLPAPVFSTALWQNRNAQAAYCRSLGRLHLAAMEELKLKRLFTLDAVQGRAARALGFEVIYPGQRYVGSFAPWRETDRSMVRFYTR